MEYLHRTHGYMEIYDQADEFNPSLKYALEVCREISRRKLGMTWQVSLRASPFSADLAHAMREAGCWCVSLGIESASENTLRGIRKDISLSQVESTCALLKGQGIKVRAHFMLYNVWEEDGRLRFEDTQMSLNTLRYARLLFCRRLIDYITWSVTMPFPGSELYRVAEHYNLINPRWRGQWDSWLQEEVFVMDLPGVHPRERRRVKALGEWLRVQCMLRNRDYHLKDIPFILKRAIATIRDIR